MTFTLYRTNQSPSLADTIKVDNVAYDLTGSTVKLQMRPVGSSTLKINAAAVVLGPATAGNVRYDWAAGDVDTADQYAAWWRVTLPNLTTMDTDEFPVWVIEHSGAAGGVYYTSPDAVRAVLGVNSTTLPDAAAALLITFAEDAVDQLLGAWPVDLETGRKILVADVEGWQWDRLGRATAKLAARFYSQPSLLSEQQWTSVRGPDFAFSGPGAVGALAALVGAEVMTTLDGTQLRRLSGKATRRRVSRWSENDQWWGDDGW